MKWFNAKRRLLLLSIGLLVAMVVSIVLPARVTIKTNRGFIAVSMLSSFVHAETVGEVVSKRTQTSSTTYLGGGKYELDTAVAPVHYKDTQGDWQNINTALINVSGIYQTTQADYTVRILQNTFNAGRVISFAAQNETVTFQPMNLEWTNDLDQIQPIQTPRTVSGTITNSTVPLIAGQTTQQGTIKWLNAYGTGIDFEWTCENSRLAKTMTVNILSSLPTPTSQIINGGNPVLRLNLIFDLTGTSEIYVNGNLWNRRTKVTTMNVIEFRKNEQTIFGFMPLMYWDSSGNTGQSIATLERRGSSLYISIRVPYSWLQTAVFPVFIDTNVDVQVGATTDSGGSTTQNTPVTGLGSYLDSTTMGTSKVGAIQYHNATADRFSSVTIPNGATIDAAYLTYTCSTTRSTTTVNLRIASEDSGTPASLAGEDFSTLTQTTAKIDWNGVGSWTANVEYNTPSLVSIIQELMASYSYATGAAMVFLDYDNGSTTGALNITRQRYTYSGSTTKCAKLHIEYTSAVTVNYSANQTSYNFGVVRLGSTVNTSGTWILFTNSSTVTTNISVKMLASNWTSNGGTSWIHSDTAAGANTAAMKANSSNSTDWSSSVFVKYNSPFNEIGSSIAAGASYASGLSLLAPTSVVDGYTNNNTVRFSFYSSS